MNAKRKEARWLIVGASGFIGSRIYRDALSRGLDVAGTFHRRRHDSLLHLDVTDKGNVLEVIKTVRPDTILWIAGEKDVRALEASPETGMAVNARPLEFLVDALDEAQLDSRVVLLSSDYLFDGLAGPYDVTDPVNPHTVYGRSKQRAEETLQTRWRNGVVVRTSAVMGAGGTFFDFLVESLGREGPAEFFENLNLSPTAVTALSRALLEIAAMKSPRPLYHVAGDRIFSRYEFARLAGGVLNAAATIVPARAELGGSLRPDMTLTPSKEIDASVDWPAFILEEADND